MNEWLPGDPQPNGDGTYTIHLCAGCIDELAIFWPYDFPREKAKIILVDDISKCDNSVVVLDNSKRLAWKNDLESPYYKR